MTLTDPAQPSDAPPPADSRRAFLRSSALASLGLPLATWLSGCDGARGGDGAPASAAGAAGAAGGIVPDASVALTLTRPAGQNPVHALTSAARERVRVAFIGAGGRGSSLMHDVLGIEFADIIAVCDLRSERAEAAAERINQARGKRPAVIGGSEDAWSALVARDDIDVVYIATPWEWHVPMALGAMEHGKHAFVEVAAAVTVTDCWRLVDTSERTQRHCVMLENCCYGENELLVLNLARQGVFGELTHGECAYIHDLRSLLFDLGGEGGWRRNYHLKYNGNLYPTHGLGPVAQYLGVGRGDQFRFLVSVSSPEKGLTRWRDQHQPNAGKHADERYVCGDMNTSIIKTELGRTIMLQHDVISPRPYSRINALSGTGATFFDYPARLAVNDPKAYGLASTGSHEWLGPEDLAKMRERFTHPLWRRLAERAKGSGHGGMDFVMNWRHLDCIRQGVTPDSVVYDAAAWSCIIEISARSVATGSMPVAIPDFSRGLWKGLAPLAIAT
jgi:hypothetical protein